MVQGLQERKTLLVKGDGIASHLIRQVSPYDGSDSMRRIADATHPHDAPVDFTHPCPRAVVRQPAEEGQEVARNRRTNLQPSVFIPTTMPRTVAGRGAAAFRTTLASVSHTPLISIMSWS